MEINSTNFFIKGYDEFRNENFAQAIENYTEAIKLDPDNAKIYNNRGVAKEELGEFVKAIEDFRKALEIDPNYGGAIHNLKRLESKIKDCKS